MGGRRGGDPRSHKKGQAPWRPFVKAFAQIGRNASPDLEGVGRRTRNLLKSKPDGDPVTA